MLNIKVYTVDSREGFLDGSSLGYRSWDGSRLHKLLARLQGSKMGSGPSNKSNPTIIQSVIGSSSDDRRYANNCMRVVTLSCNATAYNVDCEPIGLHRQLQQL